MQSFASSVGLFLLSFAGAASALQVTPASHCAIHCLDSPGGNEFKASESNTYTRDISCRDLDYSTTDAGIKFRRCMDCLQTSSKVDQSESDLKWYIYNLRFTLSTCLFGVPESLPNGTVASQCNIDKACRSLKSPLTGDGLKPTTSNTWAYCTADDGVFMGSGLDSCISCLQATEGEVYMSNFLTALQAGCRQSPPDGSLLRLSSSVFTTSAVNMTDPASNKHEDSSGSLSPSAIAGIAIGVVIIFIVALALLCVHLRRERVQDAWDRAHYHASYLGYPGAYAYRGAGNNMSQAYRRYHGFAFGEKGSSPAAAGSAGEYYDRMEAQFKISKYNPHETEKSESHGSSTTMNDNDTPVGHQGFPRSDGCATPPRTPSPPAHRRSNTPDSFAIRQYLQAAEESAKLANRYPQPPEPVAQPPRKGGIASKLPSFNIPSFSRFRPKAKRAPRISLPISTSVAARQEYEMQMSESVHRGDMRFHDRPIGDRIIYAHERPPSPGPRRQDIYYNGYFEVPLRSGKSTLYGY